MTVGLNFYILMDYLKLIQKNKFILISSSLFVMHSATAMTEEAYLKNIHQQKYSIYQEVLKSNASKNQLTTQSLNSTPSAGNQNLDNGYKIVNCWDEAGRKYGLDPWLIFAYAQTESTLNPLAINKNRSSIDRGLMQINSYWLATLKKYNISTEHLFDSCVSIFVGSWIIRQNINQYGYNYNGLVAYNVGNPFDPNKKAVGQKYYGKLMQNYDMLKKKYN